MLWIRENLSTIIICIVLLASVFAVIVHLVRNKKKGKSSCGCGCENCPMGGSCHKEN
ncbi:MAG: FeoB-associated Cys-rich membrane protein [Bacillota bacterium]|nr:FeoB-associated Cys-rich membrane protein [Bacillota bacterium]